MTIVFGAVKLAAPLFTAIVMIPLLPVMIILVPLETFMEKSVILMPSR